ncbi:MAG: Cytochrome c, class I [Nitrospira sp.]|nr:Cytochrome c, class I [Nitrospira sp.]
MAYKAHACLGCHTIEENGKLIGGSQNNGGLRYGDIHYFRQSRDR